MTPLSIWTKVDLNPPALELQLTSPFQSTAADTEASQSSARRRRVIFFILDISSTLFWLYAVTKVLIFDFDSFLIHAFLPGYEPMLQFRALFFIAIAAGLVDNISSISGCSATSWSEELGRNI